MSTTRIHVCPLDQVEQQVAKSSAKYLVSLINEPMIPPTPDTIHSSAHLKLAFNDIDVSMTGLVPPSHEHMKNLLAFILNWDQSSALVIHCWAGISRSTAAAFTAFCALNPTMAESDIAWMIRERSPAATPNSLMVSIGDNLLGRSGRMIAAVEEIGRGETASIGDPFSACANLKHDDFERLT